MAENFYEIKTIYLEPVEESDEFKKVTKTYLVTAVSVTDAEATIIEWAPSNYRDFQVDSVKKMNLIELKFNDTSEENSFFKIKVLDDDDGKIAKPKPIEVMYEAIDISDAIERVLRDWQGANIEKIEKYKNIVDEDLVLKTESEQE